MGYKHSREEILESAVLVAVRDGLRAITFRRVAEERGTSDRIVVYYFPTKTELVAGVLGVLGEQLQATLGPSLQEPCVDALDLARTAWPLLARPEADPVFARFFEALGLAVSGAEPYHSLAPPLVQGWIDWMSDLFSGTAARRRAQAEAALALLDGLLLLRQVAGPRAADRAAKALFGP